MLGCFVMLVFGCFISSSEGFLPQIQTNGLAQIHYVPTGNNTEALIRQVMHTCSRLPLCSLGVRDVLQQGLSTGVILTPREHSAMSGVTFGCHDWGQRGVLLAPGG